VDLICTVFNELNDKFCVGLGCSPPPPFPTAYHPRQLFIPDTERSVFIEDSNLGKIAKAAAENGSLVVEVTAGGLVPRQNPKSC
jgi:hypothetical protein